MKKLVLSGMLFLATTASFAQTKINEGSITYSVDWKLTDQQQPMAAMLPKEITVYFKGDSSSTSSKTQMSSTKFIMNGKTDYMRLLLDIPMAQKKLSVKFSPADQEVMKDSWPDLELKPTTETTTMAGYKAQKYTVTDKKTSTMFDAYFTKDISLPINSIDQFYEPSYGFPLKFNSSQTGIIFTATVKEVKAEKAPADAFSAAKDYEEMTFEQLKGMMGGRK